MEANREAAISARELARQKLGAGDIEGAERMLKKSMSLFMLDESAELGKEIVKVKEQIEVCERVARAADFFVVLGVARTAEDGEIKKAYHKLAKTLPVLT